MIITNGTISKRFDKIVALPKDLLSRICFKFSYHYLELKEKKLFDLFFSNIQKVRDAGCSFSLELTPNDEAIPFIDEIIQQAKSQVGAPCHVTVARNDISPLGDKPILSKLAREEYVTAWQPFNSDMFDYKMSIFGVKRKEFCYAGAWSGHLNLGSGDMKQCYCSFLPSQNIFENVDAPIRRIPVGKKCSLPHCYNGHAFLTLGLIPEHNAIPYAMIRNRITDDGREWLTPKMKAFLSNKLKDANVMYTPTQKAWHGFRYSKLMQSAGKALNR